jgi:hypothetical protein
MAFIAPKGAFTYTVVKQNSERALFLLYFSHPPFLKIKTSKNNQTAPRPNVHKPSNAPDGRGCIRHSVDRAALDVLVAWRMDWVRRWYAPAPTAPQPLCASVSRQLAAALAIQDHPPQQL